MKLIGSITAAGSLLFVATPSVADPYGGFGHMMWDGGYGMFVGFMMLIFWILIIGLIFLAVRGFSNRSDRGNDQSAISASDDNVTAGADSGLDVPVREGGRSAKTRV